MSSPAYIPVFSDAYLADTQHLTLEEHGAYWKLLLCAWRTEACELPDDDKRIATMLGISAGKWIKLKFAVMAFWTKTDTGWHQKRLTKERAFVAAKIAKNVSAARTRWNDKSLKNINVVDAPAYPPEHAAALPLTPTHLTEDLPIEKSIGGNIHIANPLKAIFDNGLALLVQGGVPQKQARGLIGKWRRDHGDGILMEALTECAARGITNPVEWMVKALAMRSAHKRDASGYSPIEATAPAL